MKFNAANISGIFLALGILSVSGCSNDEIDGSYVIKARISSISKTAIGNKTSGGTEVCWQKGDAINANGQTSFGLSQGGGTSAEFHFASPLSKPCNCIYPAYSLTNEGVNILSDQAYREGSFDPAVGIMLSSGNRTNSLEFSHAMAYYNIVPLSNSGGVTIKSATIVSMGEEMLSGYFSTDFEKLFTIPGKSSSRASVICTNPIPTGKGLMIAVPAGTYTNGLMLIIREDETKNRMVLFNNGPVEAKAGYLYDCRIDYSRDAFPDNLYLLGDALKNGKWTTPAIVSGKGDGIYESDWIELEFNEQDLSHTLGFKLFETNPSVTGIWSPQYGMTHDSGAGQINILKGSEIYQVYPGKLGFASGKYKVTANLAAMTITLTPKGSPGPVPPTPLQPTTLVDQKATAETRALYSHLKTYYSSGKTMFGAQIPTLFGIDNWHYWGARNNVSTDKSDTKLLTGSHPAVCGWELAYIEKGSERDVDGNYFSAVRNHIQAAYRRGAVNTISWHCCNPATDGNYNDSSVRNIIDRIIEGGDLHSKFCSWMDKAADFLASLTDDDGNPIPIIFRPWHEHTDRGTGSGFWWSVGNNSNDSYKKLWKMTYEYLTNTKGLHNLIWAYSPDLHHLCWDEDGYNKYVYTWAWPGDQYVDILGLDAYHTGSSNFDSKASEVADYAISLADEKGKIFAVTETGLLNNDWDSTWWTDRLYNKLISGKKTVYVLVWRNDYNDYYFNAFRGCCSENNFLEFVNKENVLLENELEYLYE